MGGVALPAGYNYVGIFLTFACRLGCTYCLARYRQNAPRETLSGAAWCAALNRLETRPDLPLTLQGGEPTEHPDFYDIISGLKPELSLDLLTNLQFDEQEFMRRIPPERFRRAVPYASIRISYHLEKTDEAKLFARTLALQRRGYPVGIWGVLHPRHSTAVRAAQARAQQLGIDFRLKEFLGTLDGTQHGTYRYPDAVGGVRLHRCRCRPSELLVAPDGLMYRCHRDLYAAEGALGSLADGQGVAANDFLPCGHYGECHPCDIKVKNNRFQEYGHTAVCIEDVE